MNRQHIISLALLLSSGCYQTAGVADGGADDAGTSSEDARGASDATVECASYGETRVCGEYCTERCPAGFMCSRSGDVCYQNPAPDGRGVDLCLNTLSSSLVQYCHRGTYCLRTSMSGTTCVSREYCDFAASGDAIEGHYCEYADGTRFVNGPPDDPCVEGDPAQPFCGGRCGDTCHAISPADWDDALSCVGVSESRGIGLCTWEGSTCRVDEETIGSALPGWIDECEMSLLGPCACVIPLDGALAPNVGWLITARSCVAYRALYPDSISCRGRDGEELP